MFTFLEIVFTPIYYGNVVTLHFNSQTLTLHRSVSNMYLKQLSKFLKTLK